MTNKEEERLADLGFIGQYANVLRLVLGKNELITKAHVGYAIRMQELATKVTNEIVRLSGEEE